MKIAWIQDFDIFTTGGGAQLTDRTHVEEIIRRGHEVKLLTPQTHFDLEMFADTLVVASNPNFLQPIFFEKLVDEGLPFVYFFHDYWPICKWRLFYPMSDSCKEACPEKPRWINILQQAEMLVFMSPLHRESILWLCPELERIPYQLSPSPVQSKNFWPIGLKRQGVIGIESLNSFKGRAAFLQWVLEHPDTPVTAIGGNEYPEMPLPSNVTYIEQVPQHKLNQLLNEHEALLHLPVSPSPFDRTCAEAIYAGCKIIGNDLVGALSYPWFTDRESVKKHCEASPGLLCSKLNDIYERSFEC
jgi:hypothetical protein